MVRSKWEIGSADLTQDIPIYPNTYRIHATGMFTYIYH